VAATARHRLVAGINLPAGDCAAASGQLDGQVAGFVGRVAACAGSWRNGRGCATWTMRARMPLSVKITGIAPQFDPMAVVEYAVSSPRWWRPVPLAECRSAQPLGEVNCTRSVGASGSVVVGALLAPVPETRDVLP
jgi:hypothetical protein